MYFYQDTAPSGWTIQALAKDCLLAVKADTTTYNIVAFSNSSPGVIILNTATHGFAKGMKITTLGIVMSGSGSDLNGDWTILSVSGASLTLSINTSTGFKSYVSGGTTACSTDSTYSAGGTISGTWQQPDHALSSAEMAHVHDAGTNLAGNSGGGVFFRAYATITDKTGAISSSTAADHNHGYTYRNYGAVGIICARD